MAVAASGRTCLGARGAVAARPAGCRSSAGQRGSRGLQACGLVLQRAKLLIDLFPGSLDKVGQDLTSRVRLGKDAAESRVFRSAPGRESGPGLLCLLIGRAMIRTVRHQCYFQREPAESEAALRRTVQTGSSWREVRS